MPLFLVQDEDRPMYVIANKFELALDCWKKFIAEENGWTVEEVELAGGPQGVRFICSNDEIIISTQNSECKPLMQDGS